MLFLTMNRLLSRSPPLTGITYGVNRPIADKEFARVYKGSVTDQSITTLQNAYGIQLPGHVKNKRKLLRNVALPEMGAYIMTQLGVV